MPLSLSLTPLRPTIARGPSRRGRVVAQLATGLLMGAAVLTPSPLGAQDGPQVTIEKATDGVDADSAPGPSVEPGAGVTWTWTVTASGTTTLYDLVVSDSSGVSPDCDVTGDGQPDGTSIHPGPVDPGGSFRCTATGAADHSADAGPFAATATVRATDFAATGVFEASDPSHHTVTAPFVAAPGISISAMVNGQVADGPTGPLVAEGQPITWTYVVTNTGNVPVEGIEVDGGAGADVDCGDGTAVVAGPVEPGASVRCQAGARAAELAAGPQTRTVSAAASAVDPSTGTALTTLTASDPTVYTPVQYTSQLAFTGPADLVLPIGLGLTALGLVLLLLARNANRHRALRPVPVAVDGGRDTDHTEPPEPTS